MQVLATCTGNFTKAIASGRQAFPSLGDAYALKSAVQSSDGGNGHQDRHVMDHRGRQHMRVPDGAE